MATSPKSVGKKKNKGVGKIKTQPSRPALPIGAGNARQSPAPDDTIVIGAGLDLDSPESPLAPYFCSIRAVAVAVCFALLFMLANFIPLNHTDVWGHLSFGRWIVAHGELPTEDPLCPFADAQGQPLVASWLAQVVFFLVYQVGSWLAGGTATHQLAGGVELLRFTHACLVLARFALLGWAFYRMSKSLAIMLAGLVLVALLASGSMGILRPQVLGELCFAVVLVALSAELISRRALLIVPIVLVLWANAHNSVFMGLLTIAAFVVGRTLQTALAGGRINLGNVWRDQPWRRVTALLAISIAAVALLNPLGPSYFGQVLAMARHPVVLAMDEWQPIAFTVNDLATWLFLGTAGILLASQALARRWLSLPLLLLVVVSALPPLRHQRMLVWWFIIAPWALVQLWSASRFQPTFAVAWGTRTNFRNTLMIGLLAGVVVLWAKPVQWLMAGRPSPLARSLSGGTPYRVAAELNGDAAHLEERVPALARVLTERYPDGRFRGTIFASETLGDYLQWSQPESSPVFIYSHVHLFSADHWKEVWTIRQAKPGWRQLLDQHHINLIVVEAQLHPALRRQLLADAHWEIVVDETGSNAKLDRRGRLLVAVRKTPR